MYVPLLPTVALNFTQLDRQDMLARLQKLFTQVSPDYQDYSPNFAENLLLEGAVTQGDVYRFMMEERTRQLWLATLTDRLAAIRKGQLYQFRLTGATAPVLTGTFRLMNSQTAARKIPIPAGTRVVTQDATSPVRYRHSGTADLEIDVGGTSVSASMEGCELASDEYESSEAPNMVLPLSRYPVVENLVTGRPDVTVTVGTDTYELVDSLAGKLDSGLPVTAGSKVCVVLVDNDGRPYVVFGNDILGKIPQGTISISYKVGGGRSTEVSANTLWAIEDTITDEAGQPVSLEFINTAASSAAVDQMGVAEARVLMPLSLRTNKRSITDDDYEYAAVKTSGIARAKLITSNHDSSIIENYGRLSVVAKGTRLASGRTAAATANAAKLAEIAAVLTKGGSQPAHQGFRVDVVAASTLTISGALRIHKARGYSAVTVKANLSAAWANFFAPILGSEDKDSNGNSLEGQNNPEIDFGASLLGSDGLPDYLIPWSSIYNALRDAEGVRHIPPSSTDLLLLGARASVTLAAHEFPLPGTLTVYDMDQSGVEI